MNAVSFDTKIEQTLIPIKHSQVKHWWRNNSILINSLLTPSHFYYLIIDSFDIIIWQTIHPYILIEKKNKTDNWKNDNILYIIFIEMNIWWRDWMICCCSIFFILPKKDWKQANNSQNRKKYTLVWSRGHNSTMLFSVVVVVSRGPMGANCRFCDLY